MDDRSVAHITPVAAAAAAAAADHCGIIRWFFSSSCSKTQPRFVSM